MDLLQFLEVFNGVVSFRCNPVQHHVYVDATLISLGVCGNRVYAAQIPESLRAIYSITHYEMLNIVVAVKAWAHLWQN